MENDRPKGDETEKPLESKKRSFLETWQQRLSLFSEVSDKEENSSDDEEKEDSKESKTSKRWQKLFSSVFGGIVKSSPVESKPAQENIFGFAKLATESGEIPLGSTENIEASPEQPATSEVANSEPTQEIPEPLGSEENNNVQGVADESETKSGEKVEPSSEPVVISRDSSEGPPADPPEVIAALRQSNTEAAPAERAEPITAPTEVKERVIERDGRGVGVAAGLFGLEFLARRRADRKLRQEIKRLDKELKAKNPETLVKSNTETQKPTETLPNLQPIPEARIPSQETVPISATETRSNVQMEQKIVRPELLSHSDKDKDLTPEIQASVGEPEKVLENVAKAAEKNDPIEKLYERRHEIKDEPLQQLGAAPVSAILSRSHTESQSAFAAATQKIVEAQKTAKIADSEQPGAYKQAIKNGFWTAIILIVVVGIFLLSRSL